MVDEKSVIHPGGAGNRVIVGRGLRSLATVIQPLSESASLDPIGFGLMQLADQFGLCLAEAARLCEVINTGA